MSLKDLSDLDFAYFRDYAKKMQLCHDKEFMEVIDPDLIRAFYRGKNKKQTKENLYAKNTNSREHFLTFSRIYQASNTILPNLYYQNPKILGIAGRGADANSAALMTAALNFYRKPAQNNAKRENQEAVMNTWFFGIGWKKLGYRTVFMPRVQEPETDMGGMAGILEKAKSILGMKPDNTESRERPDIVDYEGLYNNSESPMNIMLDHKADLANSKCILHRLPRTLHDLMLYGDYDEQALKDIYEKNKYGKGSRLSTREIDLNLNELHIIQRNGTWILTWVDEYHKPLKYELSTYQGKGFQFEPLVFSNEPGIRYPISHMKVATQIQEHLDYLATLYIRIIDRMRNQIIMNEKALSPGTKQAVERNKTGGIIWVNQPVTAGLYAQLTSAQVPPDLSNLMALLQQNVTEILGTDEQSVAGKSKNDTLGQDQLAKLGTQVRESGMLDKVRDWEIRQAIKEGILLKQYSNAELHLQITAKDYSDPISGKSQEEKWVEFMTETNPLGLKHYLQGEFDYDLNVYEAIKPDKVNARKQYMDMLTLGSQQVIRESMLEHNKTIRVDQIADEIFKNFDGVSSPDRFIEDLDSRQVAAIQAKNVLMQTGGVVPGSAPQVAQASPQDSSTSPSPAGQNGEVK